MYAKQSGNGKDSKCIIIQIHARTSAKALTLKSIGSSPKGSSSAIEINSSPIKPIIHIERIGHVVYFLSIKRKKEKDILKKRTIGTKKYNEQKWNKTDNIISQGKG